MTDRILRILEDAGLFALSTDKNAKLVNSGLDSLTLALLIVELEREFKIKIPVIPLKKEKFESVASIEDYLLELGVE